MDSVLPSDIAGARGMATVKPARRKAHYSVRWADGELPLVELTASGFVLAAGAPPPVRGYTDIFAGDERIMHGLVMCTWARNGLVGYEFKRGGSLQEIRVDHAPPTHSGLLSGPG